VLSQNDDKPDTAFDGRAIRRRHLPSLQLVSRAGTTTYTIGFLFDCLSFLAGFLCFLDDHGAIGFRNLTVSHVLELCELCGRETDSAPEKIGRCNEVDEPKL
ncbi:hypothetical protein QBC47DRAFT_354177, partial [Echria macrotheca]